MAAIPEIVSTAWEYRDDPVVFSTVDRDGNPNAIYVTCVSKYDDENIIVANNYFKKTLENLNAGSKGSILFITKEGGAYQIKGSVTLYKEGVFFEDMKKWNPKSHPGHSAAVLKVEEVYEGARKLA